jgi:hypothetical protein
MKPITAMLVVLSAAGILGGCVAVPVGPGYYAGPGYYTRAPVYYGPPAYYGPSLGIGIYGGRGGRGHWR